MRLARLASEVTAVPAMRICEAAEDLGFELEVPTAVALLATHDAAFSQDGNRILEADLKARLTATAISMAGMRGFFIENEIGSVLDRAQQAVECDPFGISVSLRFEDVPGDGSFGAGHRSRLERSWTFTPTSLLVAEVRAFGRIAEDAHIETAYPARPGSDGSTINDQAVQYARRLSDSCPEVDRVDVQVVGADLQILPDGEKRLRTGVVPRPVAVARSVAFQACVAEALGAESWTQRLRAQAGVSQDLVELLRELPLRLKSRDTKVRRQTWGSRVEALAKRIADLPTRPVDHLTRTDRLDDDGDIPASAAEFDDSLRRPDRAKNVLDFISGVLVQVGQRLDGDRSGLVGAGTRLSEARVRLEAARLDGAPTFSGIGETLPTELDALATDIARLLTAVGVAEVQTAVDRTRADLSVIGTSMTAAARRMADRAGEAVAQLLDNNGVRVERLTIPDHSPIVAWRDQKALLLLSASDISTAFPLLQGLSRERLAGADPANRIAVLVADGGEAIPFGLETLGGDGALPLSEEAASSAAVAAGLIVRSSTFRQAVADACDALCSYSYEQVRLAEREPDWWIPELSARTPLQVEAEVRATFGELIDVTTEELPEWDRRRSVAASLVIDLCAAVSQEESASGLAAQVASINLRALEPPPEGSALHLLNLIHEVALEADRRW